MQDKTTFNRLGDVILWFGTAVSVLCLAVSALNAYWYVVGTKPHTMLVEGMDIKNQEEIKKRNPFKEYFLTEEQAGFEFPTTHNSQHQVFAVILAMVGAIAWLVFASIAYIFNGRSPVAVIKGLFVRSQ